MRYVKIPIALILAALFFSEPCWAGGPVTWLTTHWPPFMVLDEESRGISGGQYGRQLLMLQESLPEYVHGNLEMTWSRFWYVVKKGERVCNCMAFKTPERELYTAYSIPISIVLPNRVVMRHETIIRLGSPPSISLVGLMQDRRLKGVLIKSRSYSPGIDDMLETYEKESNIIREVLDEQTAIKMLALNRMDYILEYPFAVTRTLEHLPEFQGKLGFLPIKEIAPFYFVYVACPKTPWGERLVGRINRSLNRLRSGDEFRSAMTLVYSGKELERITAYYDRHLLPIRD